MLLIPLKKQGTRIECIKMKKKGQVVWIFFLGFTILPVLKLLGNKPGKKPDKKNQNYNQ